MKKLIFVLSILTFLNSYCYAERYFAEIKFNYDTGKWVTQRVIVADSQEWCEENLGGDWVETYMGNNYASIGAIYNPATETFSVEKYDNEVECSTCTN